MNELGAPVHDKLKARRRAITGPESAATTRTRRSSEQAEKQSGGGAGQSTISATRLLDLQRARGNAATGRVLRQERGRTRSGVAAALGRTQSQLADRSGTRYLFEFRVGAELPVRFAQAAKDLARDAPFGQAQVRRLQRTARDRDGKMSEVQRMFLAGLLDADNVRRLSRTPITAGSSVAFSLESIRDGMPKVRKVGRTRTRGGMRQPAVARGSRAQAPLTPRAAGAAPPAHVAIARTPTEEVVETFTSWWRNLDEKALATYLLTRARAHEFLWVQQVLDELGSTDRDDVSLKFMEAATGPDLASFVGVAGGRALLDRCFDELTAGSVAEAEQRQADRIIAAKGMRISTSEFESGVKNAKVFPFRLPGLTVFSDAPINAERREGGKIWVEQPVRVLGTDAFRQETLTLPPDVFISGIELPEDEIVGVKMYDLGGEVHYRPALYLIQLANMADMKTLGTAAEAATLGLTLGSGVLVAEGTTLAARVLLAADRAAFAVGTITSIVREHRGWILERFGDKGKTFLHYIDVVSSAVAIYGGVRALVGMGQLVNGLRKSLSEWRATAAAAESELTAAQRQLVKQVDQQAGDVLKDVEVIQSEPAAASAAGKGGAGTVTEGKSTPAGRPGDTVATGPPAPKEVAPAAPREGSDAAAQAAELQRGKTMTPQAVPSASPLRVPNAERATVDPRKITEYALNPDHPVGGNKARVFQSATGFDKTNYQSLVGQINEGVRKNAATLGKADQFGQRYTVDIVVTGPKGTATVRTGWIIKAEMDVPSLTTLYVK